VWGGLIFVPELVGFGDSGPSLAVGNFFTLNLILGSNVLARSQRPHGPVFTEEL
jgi:hypothetical protein